MQTKKKGKEKDLGEALHTIGWDMAKRFTDCVAYELAETAPHSVFLTLKYRPGDKYDWYDDPAISISVQGGNTTVFENMTGYHSYKKDADEVDE